MKLTKTLAVVAASLPILVSAQTERELDSHEHGSASMNVAVDEGSLYVELESPWNNLIGFEHAPSTDEQHKLVDDAMALLDKPGELFSFEGTSCNSFENVIQSSLGEDDEDGHGDKHDEHHDDDGHGDKHDEHHDDDGHGDKHDEHHDDDGHGDKHDDHHDDEHAGHDDHGEETHSSVLAIYGMTCDNVSDLTAINVDFLNIWSGFEDLDVQLIGPGGQASVELRPSQTKLDVSQVQ